MASLQTLTFKSVLFFKFFSCHHRRRRRRHHQCYYEYYFDYSKILLLHSCHMRKFKKLVC